jgi:hypothetical protein
MARQRDRALALACVALLAAALAAPALAAVGAASEPKSVSVALRARWNVRAQQRARRAFASAPFRRVVTPSRV